MLIGALLILTWLVLLVRYPLRAVPISLGALLMLGLVAGWVLWQEHRERQLLGRLELHLSYAPGPCPAAQPLRVTLRNNSRRALRGLRWDVTAHVPGTPPWYRTPTTPPSIRALVIFRVERSGNPACRCRRCVQAIAPARWSSKPRTCAAASGMIEHAPSHPTPQPLSCMNKQYQSAN